MGLQCTASLLVDGHNPLLISLSMHSQALGLREVVAHISSHDLATSEPSISEQSQDRFLSHAWFTSNRFLNDTPLHYFWQRMWLPRNHNMLHRALVKISSLEKPPSKPVQLRQAPPHRPSLPSDSRAVVLVLANVL